MALRTVDGMHARFRGASQADVHRDGRGSLCVVVVRCAGPKPQDQMADGAVSLQVMQVNFMPSASRRVQPDRRHDLDDRNEDLEHGERLARLHRPQF